MWVNPKSKKCQIPHEKANLWVGVVGEGGFEVAEYEVQKNILKFRGGWVGCGEGDI